MSQREWRSQLHEDAIDPDVPIIDPHHHLWPGLAYYQDGPYMLDDFHEDTEAGHNIAATVYVDAYANYSEDGPEHFRPVGETAFAVNVAEESQRRGYSTRFCHGIVSNINLHHPDAQAVLEAHKEAGAGRLKGVRQIACWDPAHTELFDSLPEYYEDPAFREGFSRLSPMGLTFDTCLYHFQLPQVERLVRDFPDTTIIVDHFGTPLGTGPYTGRRRVAVEEWRPLIAAVSQFPNVVVKLGGLGMFVAGYDWQDRPTPPSSDELVAENGDLYHFTIDLFGPDRCMFESNFPVDGLSSSYAVLWNSHKKIATRYSAEERSAMFFDTANRIYDLRLS